MNTLVIRLFATASLLAFFGMTFEEARAITAKDKKGSGDELQRESQPFDLQENTISNLQLLTTNYGIFGNNTSRTSRGGGFWPRNSENEYIFGGGIWFAAVKQVGAKRNKLCMVSYNPNSGNSWLVPGRIADGNEIREDLAQKYRVYFSTDFNAEGKPLDPDDGPNWPIWDVDPNRTLKDGTCYVGEYIGDVEDRTPDVHPKGPAYISGEDIFCVFKDTDLQRYEGGVEFRRRRGYPMNLEVEQMIYSWGFGDYKDFIFLSYNIINLSEDTLRECWMAPAMDMDVAPGDNPREGAANDRARFYDEDPSLNLAVQWSNGDAGESGRGFGYIGFDFLQSPAVDEDGFIRKDKPFYTNEEQLGLKTFENWLLQEDPQTDEERYNFLSSGTLDGDNGPGDRRFLTATGPFTILPGDTARVVVGIVFAQAATTRGQNDVPSGTTTDIADLVRKDIFAQEVFDDCFKAPRPPDRSEVSYTPLNNGIIVQWDATSETSIDSLEAGADFMGYRLYRARRNDFNLEDQPFDGQTRPFSWKLLSEWEMPPAFVKAVDKFALDTNGGIVAPLFDSLTVSNIDGLVIDVRRYPNDTTSWVQFFNDSLSQGERDLYLNGQVLITNPGALPTPINNIPSGQLVDSLYSYTRQDLAQISFAPLFDDFRAKNQIVTIMDSLTNGRTFIDFGDDNGDGVISVTADVRTTEKIINNIDYYYIVQAYDEGDYAQPTEVKSNSPQENRNSIQAFAFAAPVSDPVDVEVIITPEDSARMGGLYNFRFDILDNDRLRQLFGGHELEVSFTPGWSVLNVNIAEAGGGLAPRQIGYYYNDITLRDVTTDQVLATYRTSFKDTDPTNDVIGTFSEDAALWAGNDTLGIGLERSRKITRRAGTFTTNDESLYAPNQFIFGALGFSFDHFIQQFGGEYRVDSAATIEGDANTLIGFDPSVLRTEPIFDTTDNVITIIGGIGHNLGPINYEIEFLPGGTEAIEMIVNIGSIADPILDTTMFECEYLTMRVNNTISFERTDENGNPAVVSYPSDVPHLDIIPAPINVAQNNFEVVLGDVPAGVYNLAAYGWRDGREDDGFTDRSKQHQFDVSPRGTQGRYYKSASNGEHVLDFVHFFSAAGTRFILDFANKGSNKRAPRLIPLAEGEQIPSEDFEPGDKVVVSTFGGALGLPEEGFVVRGRVRESVPALDEYTDALLDEITVVPNPYYVDHIGQRSNNDSRLYFTKLPPVCTIKIFNISGDLLRTIEHDETASGFVRDANTNAAFENWDLLTDGGLRVGSQMLLAHIETPNGASTIRKFSVVVGGFRN